MAILTINHYINQANGFISDIENNKNNYYLFVGKSQPWGTNGDYVAIASNNSVAQVEQTLYSEILYGKLIRDEDIISLIPRHNWSTNTVYDAYDQNDADLYDKIFYVVTDKYEVYKCIDNNNRAQSYVKPTLTSTSGTFKTGDGYVWRYMYSIDSYSNTKFTTINYVPVSTNAAVRGNTSPGSIDVMRITDGGNSYFVYETGFINSMVNRYIVQLPQTASNTDNYYVNSSIYLKSGFGAGQIREIQSSNGVSKQIIVDSPFETFIKLDLANIVGTVASGYYVDQPYDIVDYFYTQGYFNTGETVIQSDTGTSGKVLAANTSVLQVTRYVYDKLFQNGLPIIDATYSGVLKTGTVSVANLGACNIAFVTSNGSGYTSNATVTITANGTGSGAAANAQANSTGKISAINITAVGNSYFKAPTLTISAPIAQTFNSNTAVANGTGSGSNNVINLTRLDNISLSGGTALGYDNNDIITVKSATTNATVTFTTNTTGGSLTFTIANTGAGFALSGTIPVSNIAITNSTGGTATGNTTVTYLVANVTSATASYTANDLITYTVATGNTVIGGLVSGTTYYVEFANTTVIALKASPTGTRIALTKGLNQTGHTLQGQTALADMYCDNQIIFGSGTQLNDSANGYSNNEYIRIGANTTSNIRRVVNTVNTTALIVSQPFDNSFSASANSHYKMTVAAEPVSIVISGSNGYVSNTNLNSIQVAISNSYISGLYFSVGEKANMTDISSVNQGANAIIAYANATTVILSGVNGTWLANSGGTQFYVSGESSLQRAKISSIQSSPNITLSNPNGTFKLGYPVNFKTAANSVLSSGNATLVAKVSLPNDQTEYQIGPTVKVTGDGSDAVAIAVVNTAANSNYDIIGIDIVNPGTGYTQANISIYANTNYGVGAKARAIISPVFGHGYDPVAELGGRYVGIDIIFDTLSNENQGLLGYGSYRKAGILQNPQFLDIRVGLTNFDRVNLSVNSSGNAVNWTPGEVVLQSTTNAAGVVVYGNSTFLQLRDAKGTFNISNTVYAYYSGSSANVISSNTIYFPVGNSAEIATQANSGATGIVISEVSNTVYFMSNVTGQFAAGDIMYDSVVNAYATVSSIYTANGTKDVTYSFGDRFNQTARITLTSNTGAFSNGEYVQQNVSLAKGRVLSSTNDKDLVFANLVGSFAPGQTITDANTNANGICIFANSTYLKLTCVSQNLVFGDSRTGDAHFINNGSGANAISQYVFPVLVLDDVSDVNNFQSGSNNIVGLVSGATGICNNHLLVRNPDLVRDSGKLIYSESFAPVTRSATTKEEIKLVIKF
jgi:hypothetical protein